MKNSALILAMSLAFVLTACDKSGDTASQSEETAAPAVESLAMPMTQADEAMGSETDAGADTAIEEADEAGTEEFATDAEMDAGDAADTEEFATEEADEEVDSETASEAAESESMEENS